MKDARWPGKIAFPLKALSFSGIGDLVGQRLQLPDA
jgi:hypothetical protein